MSNNSSFVRSSLRTLLRMTKAFGQKPEPKHDDSSALIAQSYYQLAATCQIPKLGTIYELYFGRRNDGCFVEVGAYDGEYVSNTSCLADLGWRGYYVEPVPEYAELCRARHSKNWQVTVSQCAIGAYAGEILINVGGPLSTVSDQIQQHFESLAWGKGHFIGEQVQVEQMTLEQYLVLHNIERGFELLVVDVEGNEWNVLRDYDLQRWHPQMVVIELHDQNPDYISMKEENNKIVRFFDMHDYKVIYKDFTNTIYVPKESDPSPRGSAS
jgi:FkbM family methyltransferase